MTHQPNNVSAAGVSDERVDIQALREHANKGWGDDCLIPKSVVAMLARELEESRRAAASAQATAPVGWFVQRSSFGPWIEVERYEDGAVRLHRMDGDQATGQAVTEGYKLVPAEPTDEMVDAACPVGEVVDHFDMKMALRSGIAAAPYPAAREAGDGVKLTDAQRTTIQNAADKLRTVWANHTGDKESRELCHKLEDLLREAGSR